MLGSGRDDARLHCMEVYMLRVVALVGEGGSVGEYVVVWGSVL